MTTEYLNHHKEHIFSNKHLNPIAQVYDENFEPEQVHFYAKLFENSLEMYEALKAVYKTLPRDEAFLNEEGLRYQIHEAICAIEQAETKLEELEESL